MGLYGHYTVYGANASLSQHPLPLYDSQDVGDDSNGPAIHGFTVRFSLQHLRSHVAWRTTRSGQLVYIAFGHL